jgi:hypothetical protein
MVAGRRFPPPWTIEDANNGSFIVRDHNGFAVAYGYYDRTDSSVQSPGGLGLTERAFSILFLRFANLGDFSHALVDCSLRLGLLSFGRWPSHRTKSYSRRGYSSCFCD